MSRKTIHTTPHPNGGWQNKIGGNQKASNISPTKKEALSKGKEIAINKKLEHVIHNLNGVVSNSNSYGNDPNPPKDKK
jgi:hypothetical protein